MKTALERFEEKFIPEPNSGCWLWVGARTVAGYGVCGGRKNRQYAHRWAYERWVGAIPAGTEIDHLCRTRCCVNPAHLEAVSHRENILRGVAPAAEAARRTHCPEGHAYDATNSKGDRVCSVCARIHQRERSRRFRRRHAA